MSDINQDLPTRVVQGRIRMAYSLNGTQPVLCTLLCDQPLYYMEEEIFEEEENTLFYEEEQMINAALGTDAGLFQKKITIYDSVAKKFARDADARLHDFIDNARSLDRTIKTHGSFLQELTDTLRQSRYGQSLLDYAAVQGVEIRLSEQVQASAYDAQAHVVLINADQMPGDAQLALVRALRALVQINYGAGAHPLSYHPDEAILINRAQAADIAVTQIRCAWELQLAGRGDAWARLEQSQGADLARAFAREALNDFRTLNNGRAAQAAFESWFLSDRCKVEDRALIQAMLSDQETGHYAIAQNQIGPAFFAALGEQTLGRNYLTDMASLILTDPIFSDVRDRSNANFLWFVKFERSFKETERELHEDSQETIHSLEGAPHPFPRAGMQNKNDTQSMACQRTDQDAPAPTVLAGLESASNQSNIVYVSFGGIR